MKMYIQLTTLFATLLLISACSTLSNKNIAPDQLTLAPCPATPNCVSSLATDEHAIKPLSVASGSLKDLCNLINQQQGCHVITLKDNYIHAECASKLFGFIDDLEFVTKAQHIHIRSAARFGYSDLGVNRKRIEALRNKIVSAQQKGDLDI